MPCVYLLRCADGTLYCGWTTDLSRRVAAHAAGTGSRYTRSRLPVELAAVLQVPDRSAALREEARIKRLSRAQKLRLVSEHLPLLLGELRVGEDPLLVELRQPLEVLDPLGEQ